MKRQNDKFGFWLVVLWPLILIFSLVFHHIPFFGAGAQQQQHIPTPTNTPTPAPTTSPQPRNIKTIRTDFISLARKQIGVKEDPIGSNRGKEVDEYNITAGAPLGSPWCASVQHWTGKKVGLQLPNAYSPSWFPKRKIIPPEEVRSGDFAGVYSHKLKRIAHLALVEKVEENRVITLEGNTNAEGSREGHGYFRRSRLKNSLVFSRWIEE